QRLTRMPMAPAGLKWSADGRTVYCVASTWPDTPTDDAHRRRARERADSPVKALVIDDAAFRYWDRWLPDGQRPYVWAVDGAIRRHRNLLGGSGRHLPILEPTEDDYDVSPDGKELCFVADSVKDLGTDTNHDLYALALDRPDARPRNLTPENPAQDTHPVYSPDGTRLAFLRQTTKFFYADRQRLMVLDRAGGKNWEVTANLDRSAARPQWLSETELAFEAEDRGTVRLYAAALSGADEAASLSPVTAGHTDRGLTVGGRARAMAFLRSSLDHPAGVYFLAGTDRE